MIEARKFSIVRVIHLQTQSRPSAKNITLGSPAGNLTRDPANLMLVIAS